MNNKTKIEIEKIVNPIALYEGEVTESGNGAIIYSQKKYIGKKAIVIIKK